VTWTLGECSGTITIPASTNHVRGELQFYRAADSTVLTLQIAFFDVGIWKSSGSNLHSFVRSSKLTFPGTFSTMVPESHKDNMNAHGQVRRIVNTRMGERFRTNLAFNNPTTHVDYAELAYMYAMNQGRTFGGGTINPAGGQWPIIVKPGYDSCLKIGLYDIEQFNLTDPSDRVGWAPDPPFWGGNIVLLERSP
jgi:hypothetical protein